MKKIPTQAAGVIPYYMHDDGQRRFLSIQQVQGGHWAFPKGHKETNEDAITCAIRETAEEIGIDMSLYIEKNYMISDNYQYPSWSGNGDIVQKSVVYFPCQLPSQLEIVPQTDEVMDYRWGTYTETLATITKDETKNMFERFAKNFLV